MKILIRLLEAAPLIGKALAKSVDGKKTYIGVAVIAAGCTMLVVDPLKSIAIDTIVTGVIIASGGLAHKAYKLSQSKGD